MTSSNFDILPSYINDLYQHQSHTQQHLKGRISTEQPLPPSFLPPSSYWTSVEKDLFFHGLTIFSRLRPELIAEHIRTKSTYDVCLYLDTLQIAADRQGLPSVWHQLEPALDVSTRWIDYEESLAADLIARDICTLNVDRGARECTCPEDDHWDTKITGLETKECAGFLNHIDNTGLQTLDSILKEAEDERTSESGYHSSRHGTANPGRSDDDKSTRSGSLGLEMDDEDPTNTDPKARRRLLKRLYMRRKRAEKLGRELNLQAEKLRPGRASRTRPTQNPKPRPKTYKTRDQRRGRAVSVASEFVEEERSPSAPPGSRHATPGIIEQEPFEGRSKGGLTKRYRIKEALTQSGIDGDALQSAELDLFAFTALPRVINKKSDVPFVGALSISALRTMNVMLKQFVLDVIRCLVITKEQENRLKGKLKVWKNDEEEITVENVTECLQVLGFYISPDEHEDHSLEVADQDVHDDPRGYLENYQSLLISSMSIPHVQDDDDDDFISSASETDSEDSAVDVHQDEEDEEASLVFEKELWATVC